MARGAARAGVDLMPWFITDDGFPEHPKVDRLEAICGTWERFAAARTVWHDMGCDCARRLTDGAFLRVRAHRVCRMPREVVDAALECLTAAGLIRVDGADGFVFHAWAEYQPTRAKVEAMRAAKTERQRRWRDRVDASTEPSTDASTDASTGASTRRSTGASRSASRDASVDAAPSHPIQEEYMSATGSTGGKRSGAAAPLSLLPDEPPPRDEVADVFAHWQRATGKGRAVLDAKRRTLIARALKLRPAADLCRAVDGYASSPWHRGENDRRTEYLGIELMLRDAAKIEQGLDLAAKAAPSVPAAPKSVAPPAKLPPMPPDVLTPEQLRAHAAPFLEELRRKREEREAAERKRLNFGREVDP